jgi:hypothetical protein
MPSQCDSLAFLGAYLLIPAAEGDDHFFRGQRQLDRIGADQFRIFRPAELLDDVLAFLVRRGKRYILHGRPRIEVSLIVGKGLLLGLEQKGHQVDKDGELLIRDTLGHDHEECIGNPVETFERSNLGTLVW